ncbi:1377_t:CDS:1, partial [Racocetra persica]
YLDEENKILLLIGGNTIQVWYDRNKKKRTLEFIMVIRDMNSDAMDDNEIKKIEYEIKEIEYTIKRFKISIQHKDSNSPFPNEMEDENDVIKVVKEA